MENQRFFISERKQNLITFIQTSTAILLYPRIVDPQNFVSVVLDGFQVFFFLLLQIFSLYKSSEATQICIYSL
jgi:hypothetical protein